MSIRKNRADDHNLRERFRFNARLPSSIKECLSCFTCAFGWINKGRKLNKSDTSLNEEKTTATMQTRRSASSTSMTQSGASSTTTTNSPAQSSQRRSTSNDTESASSNNDNDPYAHLVQEVIQQLQPSAQHRILDEYDRTSQLATFYAGQSVFITGATGFIGKAVVEKLLRSCKDIEKIYVLIREKRNKSVDQRLNDLVQAKIFDKLRQQHGGTEFLIEKLHPIQGDITLPRFGVAQNDLDLLSEKVSIVFNSAATIRFVEPLDEAVHKNIYSVEQLFEFCDQLKNLQALIHLSTAYSNCHKKDTIYEVFYEPPMRGGDIIDCMEKLRTCQDRLHTYQYVDSPVNQNERSTCEPQRFYESSHYSITSKTGAAVSNDNANGCETATDTNKLAKSATSTRNNNATSKNASGNDKECKIINEFTEIALRHSNRPNTYTLTKAISESYILDLARKRSARYLDTGSKVKVSIMRPSIVGAAWREPHSGMVDNYNGPTGAILSLYTGVLQAMPGNAKCTADVVPVDIVVNCVIAIGWFLVQQQQQQQQQSNMSLGEIEHDQGIYLFNMVSGYRKPLKWGLFTSLIQKLGYKYPTKFLERLPGSYFVRGGRLFNLYDKLMHFVPALLMDEFKHRVYGQNDRKAMMAYSRVKQMTDTLTPFTSNQWRLCDTNVRTLYESLDGRDKHLFNFDVTSIDWTQYITNYILGSRVYLLRDEPSNIPKAKRRLNKMRTRTYASLTFIALLILYFLIFQRSNNESTVGSLAWPASVWW